MMESQETAQIGIIVVTHVDYGSALLRAVEFIAGPVQDCASIQVDATLEPDDAIARLNEAASRLDSGQGVLVLTDMFGGTPTNLSLSLLKTHPRVEVLTGVNLPMLLRVISNRSMPLSELAELARNAGYEGIVAAGSILRDTTDAQPTSTHL